MTIGMGGERRPIRRSRSRRAPGCDAGHGGGASGVAPADASCPVRAVGCIPGPRRGSARSGLRASPAWPVRCARWSWTRSSITGGAARPAARRPSTSPSARSWRAAGRARPVRAAGSARGCPRRPVAPRLSVRQRALHVTRVQVDLRVQVQFRRHIQRAGEHRDRRFLAVGAAGVRP